MFFQDFFGKETSESEDSPERGETGTGKWKVPTYKDYLYLFKSLLNCDTIKVKSIVNAESYCGFFFLHCCRRTI